MQHIDIKCLFEDAKYIGEKVTVCGWVRTSRESKTMAFAELNDGTSLKHLQIVIDRENLEYPQTALRLGTALKVEGVEHVQTH